jgi:hypothetical protein
VGANSWPNGDIVSIDGKVGDALFGTTESTGAVVDGDTRGSPDGALDGMDVANPNAVLYLVTTSNTLPTSQKSTTNTFTRRPTISWQASKRISKFSAKLTSEATLKSGRPRSR